MSWLKEDKVYNARSKEDLKLLEIPFKNVSNNEIQIKEYFDVIYCAFKYSKKYGSQSIRTRLDKEDIELCYKIVKAFKESPDLVDVFESWWAFAIKGKEGATWEDVQEFLRNIADAHEKEK